MLFLNLLLLQIQITYFLVLDINLLPYETPNQGPAAALLWFAYNQQPNNILFSPQIAIHCMPKVSKINDDIL